MRIDPLMAAFNTIVGQCGIGAAVQFNHRATAAV